MVFDSDNRNREEPYKTLDVGAQVFQYADIYGSPKQGYSSGAAAGEHLVCDCCLFLWGS